jgi:hypothetical protein
MTRGAAELSQFQARIVQFVQRCPNQQASTWRIAQEAFPDQWDKPASRGMLISHIVRSAYRLVEMGALAWVIAPETRFGEHILCGHPQKPVASKNSGSDR